MYCGLCYKQYKHVIWEIPHDAIWSPLLYTSSEWLGCKTSSCDRFFTNVAGSSCASKAQELACPRIQKRGEAAHAKTPILERPYTHY
jgi:hypothetical protein